MPQRVKTFDSTGIAPNGVLYASDLNSIQDNYAQLSDLSQGVGVGTLTVGESGLTLSRFAAGIMQIAGQLRVNDLTVVNGIQGTQIATGSITATQLGTNAVTTIKINADAVDSTKIADNAIGNEHLQDNTVNTNEITNLAVTSGKLASGAVIAGKYGAGSIVNADISASAGIAGSKLQADSVGTAQISTGGVGSDEIAAGAVIAGKFGAGAIVNADVNASAAIAGSKLAAGGVGTTQLADLNVTSGKLAAGSVIAGKYGAASIVNADVSASAAIVGSKLNASRVAATVAGLGSGADGVVGFLRIGSTPFHFLPVIYDATYGKWVSPIQASWFGGGILAAVMTVGATDYSFGFANNAGAGFASTYCHNWRDFDTAGLKPQYMVQISADTTAGQNIKGRIRCQPMDDSATPGTESTSFASVQVNGTGGGGEVRTARGVWEDMPSITLKDNIMVRPYAQTSAGSVGNCQGHWTFLRWVNK